MQHYGQWKLLLFISAALLASSCSATDLAASPPTQDDFAKFDRAYVPALALTKMGTFEASQKAMQRLKTEWRKFEAAFGGAMPADGQWQADCHRIGEAIADAEKQLDRGEQLEAHESLEKIREILLTARRRSGLVYYLDYLTEFHDTMEEIVLAVEGKKPSELSPDAIAEIRRLTQTAVHQWDEVKSGSFDQDRFGFDEKKAAQRRKLLTAQTLALGELTKALANTDKAQIIATGQAIKPIFAKNFMLFGDFPKPVGK